MTRIEAARVAIECITAAMKPLAWDANTAMRLKDTSPSMQNRLKLYRKYAEALKYYEAQARQKEMDV